MFTYSQFRKFLIFLAVAACLALVVGMVQLFSYGGIENESRCKRSATLLPENTENALAIINDQTNPLATPAVEPMDTMPSNGCVRMKIYPIGGPIARVIRDSNYLHYDAAKQIGIDPITSDIKAWKTRRPLVRISSCEEYYLADLRHSYPYLVPEAEELLREIGRRFQDSLQARGGGNYRLKVTSVLRSNNTVRRLRRVNRAAVDSSAHQFGTTFDISYTRFMLTKKGGVYRTQEDMKNLLAELMQQMRQEGKCFVIYEPRSGCFHITVRPQS